MGRLSVSTVLLQSSAIVAGASLLVMFPWQALTRSFENSLTGIDVGLLIAGAGAPLWAVVALVGGAAGRTRRARRRLEVSDAISLTSVSELVPYMDALRRLDGFVDVEFRIVGNLDGPDPGGALTASPVAYALPRSGMRRLGVVEIPAIAWSRLRRFPGALAAVLAHEIAHIGNRDSTLVFGIRRLLLVVCSLNAATLAMSAIRSIVTDGVSRQAAWATIVGKNSMVANGALLFAGALLIQRLLRWREALADQLAIETVGASNLEQAERILGGTAQSSTVVSTHDRPTADERSRALSLGLLDWFLLGTVAATAMDYAVAPFAFGQSVVPASSPWLGPLQMAAGIVRPSVAYVIFFGALRALIAGLPTETSDFRVVPQAALLLAAGVTFGGVGLQAMSLVVTSIAMPEGYDFVIRHDPGPLILSTFLSYAGFASDFILLALVGAVVASSRSSIWLGFVPGEVWIAVAAVERHSLPFFEGWLAVTTTAAVIVAVSCRTIASGKHVILLRSGVSWLPLVCFSMLGWIGMTDVSHIAATASESGFRKLRAGDVEGAIRSLRRAAALAPLSAQAWMDLAGAIAREPGRLDEAIEKASLAVRAPLSSAWEEQLRARALVAELLIAHGGQDQLEHAAKHYAVAYGLWEGNSRLPRDVIAATLYNYACVSEKLGRNALAIGLLFEAIALEPHLAADAMQDADLAHLHLARQPPPTAATLNLLNRIGTVSARVVTQAIEDGQLDVSESSRALALVVRRSAYNPAMN